MKLPPSSSLLPLSGVLSIETSNPGWTRMLDYSGIFEIIQNTPIFSGWQALNTNASAGKFLDVLFGTDWKIRKLTSVLYDKWRKFRFTYILNHKICTKVSKRVGRLVFVVLKLTDEKCQNKSVAESEDLVFHGYKPHPVLCCAPPTHSFQMRLYFKKEIYISDVTVKKYWLVLISFLKCGCVHHL